LALVNSIDQCFVEGHKIIIIEIRVLNSA